MEKKVVDFEEFKDKKAKKDQQEGKIDKEVLDIMGDEDIIKSITDEKSLARFRLNCFCEFLSQISELSKKIDELSQVVCVAYADKMSGFYKELDKNVAEEENRIELSKKMAKSHLKATKKTKTSKK